MLTNCGLLGASQPVHRFAAVLILLVAAACATQTPSNDAATGGPTGSGAASDDLSPQNLAAVRFPVKPHWLAETT